MPRITSGRRLEVASRKLVREYQSTNTALQYRIDAEENFLAAERKHNGPRKSYDLPMWKRAPHYLKSGVGPGYVA